MRMRIFLSLFLALFSISAFADDAADAGAAIHEYFAAFNAKDLNRIANDIYATPVLVGGGERHTVYATPGNVIEMQTRLFEQLDIQQWAESRISDLVVSVCSSSLAFVDTRYSRFDVNGDPLPPTVRTNLYVLQKIDGTWRIIAFFGHSNDVRPSC